MAIPVVGKRAAIMFRQSATRDVVRAVIPLTSITAVPFTSGRLSKTRCLSSSPCFRKNGGAKHGGPVRNTAATAPGEESGELEGQFARTDENVRVEYPEDHEMPQSPIIQ